MTMPHAVSVVSHLMEIYASTPNEETGEYPTDKMCLREEQRLLLLHGMAILEDE